jgi:hypothetical protein
MTSRYEAEEQQAHERLVKAQMALAQEYQDFLTHPFHCHLRTLGLAELAVCGRAHPQTLMELGEINERKRLNHDFASGAYAFRAYQRRLAELEHVHHIQQEARRLQISSSGQSSGDDLPSRSIAADADEEWDLGADDFSEGE